MKSFRYLFTTIILVLAIAGNIHSQTTLSMQGVLRDQTGLAVPDGNYTLVFAIYSAATGGTSLWSETQNGVPVVNGVFSVALGSVTAFPSSLNFGLQYWVGIKVGGTSATELAPRIQLTAAPYALAIKGNDNVLPGNGNVGIGTTNPSAKLDVAGDIKMTGLLKGGGRVFGTKAAATPLTGVLWPHTNTYRGVYNFASSVGDAIVTIRVVYPNEALSGIEVYAGGTLVMEDMSTYRIRTFTVAVKKGDALVIGYQSSRGTGYDGSMYITYQYLGDN